MTYVRIKSSDSDTDDEATETTEVERKRSLVPCGVFGTGSAQVIAAASAAAEARALAGVNIDARIEANRTTVTVTNSTGVIIGDNIITQTICDGEVVKSEFLCLQFETELKMKKFRCSLAVFLCWTLIVVSGITAYVLIVAVPEWHQTRMDIGLLVAWYLRRGNWQGLPPDFTSEQFFSSAVPYVIVGHSDTQYCNESQTCAENVWAMQMSDMGKSLQDIAPNFLVGGNGWILEGRGANVVSEMLQGWEEKSISIMFIGNYLYDSPDQLQFKHLTILLDILIEKGILHENYTLFGSCQVFPGTISPGPKLMSNMHYLSHWNSVNESACKPHNLY